MTKKIPSDAAAKRAGLARPPAGTDGHSDFDSNVSPAAGNPDGRGAGPDAGPVRLSGDQKQGGGTGATVASPTRKGQGRG